MTRWTAVLLVLLLGTAACGKDASEYAGVDELAVALSDGGEECSSLEKLDPAQPGEHISDKAPLGAERLPQEAGKCMRGSDELRLFTFADETAQERWSQLAKRLGSPAVAGPNWVVLAPSEDAAADVEEILGGEFVSSGSER
ncbi:MAG: hypothetical protein ACR2KQ_09435 [Actinomycetota bacterium]